MAANRLLTDIHNFGYKHRNNLIYTNAREGDLNNNKSGKTMNNIIGMAASTAILITSASASYAAEQIRILTPTWLGFAPVHVAIKNECFARHHLAVSIKFEDDLANVMAAMSRGDVEVQMQTRTVTRQAVRRMSAGGAIVNTSSIWGRVAEAQFDAYVASKHAIIGLTKTWAKELGSLGIRVNSVCPGWVRTEASMRSLGLMAAAQGSEEDELLKAIVAGQAMSGLMEREDMQETYLFLASDSAANITTVAGGRSRRSTMVAALTGKRAIVTGAASGIGKATAVALQSAGAEVVGLDIATPSHGFDILQCDLRVEGTVVEAVSRAAARLGGLDIVVNNAGIIEEAPLGVMSIDHIDRMFAVNVRGAIFVAREALVHLPEGGRIINIVSELAYIGRADASMYCGTKAALLALTRSWARELAPRILVNAVAPGPTDTPLLGFDDMDSRMQAVEISNPLRRIGRPEEVAASVAFLAGPGASLFVGQCLGPNCGAVML